MSQTVNGFSYLPRNPLRNRSTPTPMATMVFRCGIPVFPVMRIRTPQLYFMFQEVSDFNIEFTRNRGPLPSS